MIPFGVDPALFLFSGNNNLTGLSRAYVNDSLRTGSDSFRRHWWRTNESFEMIDEYFLSAEFTYFVLHRAADVTILIYQNSYLQKLETLSLNATFAQFRSMRVRLAWLLILDLTASSKSLNSHRLPNHSLMPPSTPCSPV